MSFPAGSLAADYVTPGHAVLAAALICAALIVLLRPLLQRYALARPNARSSHVLPTPQGAGIAVIAATLSITSLCASLTGLAIPSVLFAATAFLALVGLVDDVKPIPALPRLLLQASAIGAVLLAAPSDLRIAPICPLGVERGLLFVAGLWFVNLVNFMDGLDLMTVAEIVPITGAMIAMGWFGLYPPLPALVAAALCGAMIGFAPFNRPTARVFLGDVGSLPIGLLLGWCLLELAWHGQLIAALLLPLYYIADATLTLLRRISRGEAFWAAHRSHFYQRATDNGFTVLEVVGHVFVVNAALGAMAMASINVNSGGARLLFLAASALLVGLMLYRFSFPRKR
jgi:UDP-N-acetylmuramyl pentapeptide phosphotransferase/UDP-N-acetylglucosamine-1-phosphate transferase